MNEIPVFVSIPPTMRRCQLDGKEVGNEYQAACIQSWLDSGLDPVTINSANEKLSPLIERFSVRSVLTTRDATSEVGKPLVYLEDMAEAAISDADGVVLFTNADVRIELDSDLHEWVRNTCPGEAFFVRRLDVAEPYGRDGTVFNDGIDLIGVHVEDLKKIDLQGFVIGLPWWDHFLPLALLADGVKARVFPREASVLHLQHEERWDYDRFNEYGFLFRERIEPIVRQSTNQALSGYSSEFERIARMEWMSRHRRARAWLRSFSESGRRRNFEKQSVQLASANMKWLQGAFEQ